MDASEQFAFPSPQPQDSPEVREAIEQAGILWSEDPKESLKWLRKAAEIASDAGDDLRSVQLARVSADLRNLANISPSVPPPTTLPPISHPLPSSPTPVVDASEAVAAAVAAVVASPIVAPAAVADAEAAPTETASPGSSPTTTTPDGAATSEPSTAASGESASDATSSAENAEPAGELQTTPDVPAVVPAEATATPAAPAAEPVVAVPPYTFSKDPAQTVPATPAASAAALAMATGPANYQSVPAPASSAPQAASNGAAPLGVKRPAPALFGGGPAAGGVAVAQPGGPRPEQPTLVGRPLPIGSPNGPRGVNDETPAATPAAIQADSVAPGSTTRFVQHRAVAVAISIAPNANGHFDLHPLADGESVEPGFRRALLVALAPEDRLFPGRG